MSDPFHFRPAEGQELPLLVSIPHTGTEVADDLARRFVSEEVAQLPDTDWHLHDLYDFVPGLGARMLYARYSRYVVDLNRAPNSANLYPGRYETTLVPTRTFSGDPIYRGGDEPDDTEIARRRELYWAPYHARLSRELRELKSKYGYALLWDAHSIRSRVPLLFDGHLPDLVLGDADETSAQPSLSASIASALDASGYSHAHNRPFRGGYITRTYGNPADHIHAVQLEMSQDTYMNEDPPFAYHAERAQKLAAALTDALTAFVRAGAHIAPPSR